MAWTSAWTQALPSRGTGETRLLAAGGRRPGTRRGQVLRLSCSCSILTVASLFGVAPVAPRNGWHQRRLLAGECQGHAEFAPASQRTAWSGTGLEISALVEVAFGSLARIPGNTGRSTAKQMKAGSKYSAPAPEETGCSPGAILQPTGPQLTARRPFGPPARDDEW